MLPQNPAQTRQPSDKDKQELQEQKKLQSDVKQKWSERLDDIYLFSTLLHARGNIFVYGSNGCGKTSFVQDTLKLSQCRAVHVDCVEFYSEKLIAIQASQLIYSMIALHVKRHTLTKDNPAGIPKAQAKKLVFKLARTF